MWLLGSSGKDDYLKHMNTTTHEFSTPVSGIIFDLDGTLLDTLDDLADSLNAMLRVKGFREHSTEAVRGFIGNGMENLVRQAAPEDARIDDALVKECLEIYKGEYEKRWNAKTTVYSGIDDLLKKIALKGVPMAVLSNKLDEFTKICIAEFFPDTVFQVVLGMRETVPKKPHPAGALEIAELLGLEPEEMAFVGDSSVDIETAKAAGMMAVGVDWGFRSRAELVECGADWVVSTTEELLDLV
jgi:phosphoglycolate phosphatase